MESIFKYFTTTDKSIAYLTYFTRQIPESEFIGIDKVLYLFLDYCSKLQVRAREEYFSVFLGNELESIVKKHKIRIDSTASMNYDEISGFKQAVITIRSVALECYYAYCNNNTEECTGVEEFKVTMSNFISRRFNAKLQEIYTENFVALTQGGSALDCAESTEVGIHNLKTIYDDTSISKLDSLLGVNQYNEDDDIARKITTTGIPAIDEDYGGIFSKALFTFAGPPGAGKTRFLVSNIIYRAMTIDKVDVRFDELELARYEIKNMLVAHHIAQKFKFKIPDKEINRNNIGKYADIVQAARHDLFDSGKYGKLYLFTESLSIENLERDINTYLKLNKNVQLWCVDYTGLIRSTPVGQYAREKDHATIIDEALIIGKSVAKNNDIATVYVNQYNERGNDAALKGARITVGMIQGGQSVQRHTDYDLSMTCTEEQAAANLLMFSTTKVRSATGFTNVPIRTQKSVSIFKQINESEV